MRRLAPAGQASAGVVRQVHGASDHRPVWAVVVPEAPRHRRAGRGAQERARSGDASSTESRHACEALGVEGRRESGRALAATSRGARSRWRWARCVVIVLLYVNLSSSERKVERPIPHRYAAADSQFVRTMGSLLGPGFVPGNQVTALLQRRRGLPGDARGHPLGAPDDHLRELHLLVVVGRARQFTAALIERARAGVRTHVLIDWAGSQKVDQDDIKRLRQAGVEVVFYRPLHWYQLDRLNHRTHRKLLIVDGRVGFTGGMGVADQWLGHAQDAEHWRDSHFRVEGPVVAQLQAAFMDDWFETRGVVLDGPGYFPDLDREGLGAGPGVLELAEGRQRQSPRHVSARHRAATRRILIANSYFVPDQMTVDMLVAARRRGVDVEIIVPGPILDAQIVRRASRVMWGPMLEAGVRDLRVPAHDVPHQGDGGGRHLGLGGIDQLRRPLVPPQPGGQPQRATTPRFGAAQAAAFAKDRAQSREITLEAWRHRSLWERFEERAAGVLRKQL